MAATSDTRRASRILAWGDAICILLFAILGLLTHGEPVSLVGIIRNALPILLVWWLVAPFLRTYTRPGWQNLLYTWAVAVSAGVWLRFMVLQKPFDLGYLVFWAVTLGTTLVLLLAWRGLALLWLRGKPLKTG
jgi:peptidoglycan biosynthesis protein MviN/MurJ (putative lipid II flippase)